MTASPQTVDSPIQRDDASGGNPFYSLPVSLPSIRHEPLAQGVVGTFQTLDAMAQCVRGEIAPDFCGYRKSQIINFAARLIDGCENQQQEIARLFNYAAKQIKYEAHPIDQQVCQDACQTIRLKTGDCVSMSVLLATLLASMDYPVRFVAQYWNDDQLFSHVYVETQGWDGNEIGLDPVAKDQPMGWRQSLPDGGWETPYDIF